MVPSSHHENSGSSKKHSTKESPPFPSSMGELLQLMEWLKVLTVGLFTTHCSLATQLQALHLALQECKHKLMGNQDTTVHMILQVVWAITLAWFAHAETSTHILHTS